MGAPGGGAEQQVQAVPQGGRLCRPLQMVASSIIHNCNSSHTHWGAHSPLRPSSLPASSNSCWTSMLTLHSPPWEKVSGLEVLHLQPRPCHGLRAPSCQSGPPPAGCSATGDVPRRGEGWSSLLVGSVSRLPHQLSLPARNLPSWGVRWSLCSLNSSPGFHASQLAGGLPHNAPAGEEPSGSSSHFWQGCQVRPASPRLSHPVGGRAEQLAGRAEVLRQPPCSPRWCCRWTSGWACSSQKPSC